MQAASATRLKGAAEAARKQWARTFAERHGLSERQAERIAAQAANHVLETEFELEFDDPALGRCTVADVVGEPDKYIGETLADPLEGVGYGRGKAKVLGQDNRCLMIHSFAHGGINYQLAGQGVRLEDFRAYKPAHKYIFAPIPPAVAAESVNATIAAGATHSIAMASRSWTPRASRSASRPANGWTSTNRSKSMTWAPGWPLVIED